LVSSELIKKVEVTADNELLLALESGGSSSYQHIYREGAGVYWDDKLKGFKSTPIKEWSCEKWFQHIVEVVKSGLNIDLELSDNVTWHGIPNEEKDRLSNSKAVS